MERVATVAVDCTVTKGFPRQRVDNRRARGWINDCYYPHYDHVETGQKKDGRSFGRPAATIVRLDDLVELHHHYVALGSKPQRQGRTRPQESVINYFSVKPQIEPS